MRRILLPILLVACSQSRQHDPFVLRIALWGALGTPTPVEPESNLAAAISLPWLFEAIATVSSTGDLTPVLASRLTRVSTREMRVELRRDAMFSDGSPVRAEDVVRCLAGHGVRVTSNGEDLTITSAEGSAPLDVILPRMVIYREVDGAFLGSGPFVVHREGEDELRFLRRQPNPNRINDVRLVAYRTPREAFTHTLKGDANLIFDLDPRAVEFFNGVKSLQVIRGGGRSTEAILFNLDLPRDERVQLAGYLASDRVRELAYGEGDCAESGQTQTSAGDVPSGREKLDVLAWGPFERLALAVRRTLGERGGEVLTQSIQEVLARIKERRFELVTARPLMWPRNTLTLSWRTGSPENQFGYSNPAVDRALDAGDWDAAEKALRADPPAAFICTRQHIAVVDSRIKNPELGPYDLLQTLPEWEVAQ